MNTLLTRRFRVFGVVQGVGFRPTVSRHAAASGVRGSVCNRGPFVEIIAQGTGEQIRCFSRLLRQEPPRRAAILKIDEKAMPAAAVYSSFSIIESEKTSGEIYISPDIAVCEDCRRELYDPADRRYLHPFINCTNCGPRLTILESLPYDRERTSMRVFPMCPACAAEYEDPASRRYDAQPVCCPDCGPEVYLIGRGEKNRAAISCARKILAEGGIVAVKGIGGFHLCCDASSRETVERLRSRKHRPMKPFAVMLRDLETVHRECIAGKTEEEILTGHQKPILLMKKKPGGKICEAVAPENPKLGVMLPYTPLHLLLFDYDDGIRVPDALVMTSGNHSGAPICRDDESAVRELGTLCDAILSHNRDIRIRADDSVMDLFEGEPYMIRRSRGYAPLPVLLSGPLSGSALAFGGELKNSFCVGKGELLYPSPYIGDLEDLRTGEALKESSRAFLSMLEVSPDLAVCDLHPEYHSARIAEESGLPLLKIQHHYAHILSCMAENDRREPVIGFSFDGTGYGEDGTVWGGEVLVCDYMGCQRKGHIVPFLQAGGDAAAREGWRIAVSMLYALTGRMQITAELAVRFGICRGDQAKTICQMADRGVQTILSTSAGRLFDAVSSLLGIRQASTFEGEASMALQFAAEHWEEEQMALGRDPGELAEEIRADFAEVPMVSRPDGQSDFCADSNVKTEGLRLASDVLFRELALRTLQGADGGYLAYAFHRLFADQAVEFGRLLKLETGIDTAAVSGGVFQNLLFLRMVAEGLREQGFTVLTHHLVPANDGGIALGQAACAMMRLNRPGK